MGHPADRAGDRKHHGKHRRRNAERTVNNARIEIHVWIKLLLDKVFVFQRHLFELQRQVEKRRVYAIQSAKHFVRHFPDQGRSRVEVFIDSVTESHHPEGIVTILGPGYVFRDVFDAADFLEHIQNGLVGAAMSGSPERRNARGNRSIRVGTGTPRKAHR